MQRHHLKISLLIVALALSACGKVDSAITALTSTSATKVANQRNGVMDALRVSSPDSAAASAVAPNPTYLTSIAPLMTKYCVSCHTSKASNNVILDDYAAVVDSGSVLDKWTRAYQYAQGGIMPPPPGKIMEPADLAVFGAWIAQGADTAPGTFELGLQCTNTKRVPDVAAARRLTDFEIGNTLQQLLPPAMMAVVAPLLSNLPPDGSAGTFDVMTAAMSGSFLDGQYSLAKAAGDAVAQNDQIRTALVPCWAAAEALVNPLAEGACIKQFLPTFAAQVYRRPLSADEQTAVVALATAIIASDDVPTALGAGVQRLLFSPSFYLMPEFDANGSGNPYHISDYVLASRLSYALWGRMPDAALLALAADGTLSQPTVLKAQVERLIADDQFGVQLDHIVAEWLRLGALTVPTTSSSTTASSVALISSMQNDLLMTFRQVVLSKGGSLNDLFTTTTAYVDTPELAKIYGLTVDSKSLPLYVGLDAATRSGFLTRAGMLAYDATPVLTTIRRGRFIRQNLLGQTIANPPANVALQAASGPAHISLRDRLTASTSSYTCSFCHSLLNPPGFALGNFAPDGSYQKTEVDAVPGAANATVTIDAQVDPRLIVLGRDSVDSGSSLSLLLGKSKDVQINFVKDWYSALSGLPLDNANACVATDMYATVDGSQPILNMVRAFVNAPEFLLRSY